MAVNFGDTIMEGAIAPSVRVQAPVEDNSGAILARGFAPAAEAIGGVVGSIFKAQQQDASRKILTSYEGELLNLADAVDQGMDRNEAMIRARNLRREYLANSPDLQGDFDKIWSSFATGNGLGNVVISGTVDQQIAQDRYKKAAELGYTPEQYEAFQAVSNQATALKQQLDIIQAEGGIVTESMKNQSIQVMVGLADKAFPAAQAQINDAMARIEANPGQRAEIAAQTINQIKTSVAQLEHMTGGVGAEYITTPINNLLSTFEGWSNGSVENSVLEGQITFTQNQYDAMYATDPTLGPVIAQSKLLNELGLSTSPIAIQILNDADVLRRLREVSQDNYTLNILGQQPGDQKLVQVLNEAVTQTNLSEDAKGELADIYANIIDGAYVHERGVDDALGYKNTIEALGSAEATEFFKTNPVTARHADKFADVIAANYQESLLPAITQYWNSVPVSDPTTIGATGPEGNTAGITNTPMSQLLTPVWNGSVVEFVPNEQYADNPRIIALAQDVNTGNSSIGVPLNNLIRAISNVSGQDAKAVWESQFAGRLFGIGEEGSIADRVNQTLDQTSDTPSLEQFNFSPEVEFEQASVFRETVDLPPIDPAYTNIEGIDYNSYLPSIRAAESGGNDRAKNPLSTATGRYQFLSSTWNDLVRRYPNSGLSFEGRTNPQEQEVAIRLFTAENARYLQRNGISLDNGTLYAAHFLGAGDAAKVLKAPNTASVASIVPPKVIQSNPFLRGWTVGQFKSWAQRKGNG